MADTIAETAAVYVAKNHAIYRQNFYRFNDAAQYWEFDDGVGPWTPSGILAGRTREEGEAYLLLRANYAKR